MLKLSRASNSQKQNKNPSAGPRKLQVMQVGKGWEYILLNMSIKMNAREGEFQKTPFQRRHCNV